MLLKVATGYNLLFTKIDVDLSKWIEAEMWTNIIIFRYTTVDRGPGYYDRSQRSVIAGMVCVAWDRWLGLTGVLCDKKVPT